MAVMSVYIPERNEHPMSTLGACKMPRHYIILSPVSQEIMIVRWRRGLA